MNFNSHISNKIYTFFNISTTLIQYLLILFFNILYFKDKFIIILLYETLLVALSNFISILLPSEMNVFHVMYYLHQI